MRVTTGKMTDTEEKSRKLATETLQQLGLKEYEAKVFVSLCGSPMSTAKEVSEAAGVPRPRVYDAIRILEARGLVETEHTNPKKFDAVPLERATEILQQRYDDRIQRVRDALNEVREGGDDEPVHETRTITDTASIDVATQEMIDDAESGVVFVAGAEAVLNEGVVESLGGVGEDISLNVGFLGRGIGRLIRDEVPEGYVFRPEFDRREDEVELGRFVLVDEEKALVSSLTAPTGERAVFGRGTGNGLVVLARRLVAQETASGGGG